MTQILTYNWNWKLCAVSQVDPWFQCSPGRVTSHVQTCLDITRSYISGWHAQEVEKKRKRQVLQGKSAKNPCEESKYLNCVKESYETELLGKPQQGVGKAEIDFYGRSSSSSETLVAHRLKALSCIINFCNGCFVKLIKPVVLVVIAATDAVVVIIIIMMMIQGN